MFPTPESKKERKKEKCHCLTFCFTPLPCPPQKKETQFPCRQRDKPINLLRPFRMRLTEKSNTLTRRQQAACFPSIHKSSFGFSLTEFFHTFLLYCHAFSAFCWLFVLSPRSLLEDLSLTCTGVLSCFLPPLRSSGKKRRGGNKT